MKKINNLFRKIKPKYTYEVGGGAFKLDFYADDKDLRWNYLHITTPSGAFEQKICNYAYGYLYAAAQQGKIEELEAYCLMLYRVSDEVYQDIGFCQDIIKAFNKRDKRLMKQAESKAKTISDAQEQADAAFMNEVIAESQMSKKELKAKRELDKQLMKEMLNEEKAAE